MDDDIQSFGLSGILTQIKLKLIAIQLLREFMQEYDLNNLWIHMVLRSLIYSLNKDVKRCNDK